MKPAEKLKRIKLISEKLFVEYCIMMPFETDNAASAVHKAQVFVDFFEKFEEQFLKENGVDE